MATIKNRTAVSKTPPITSAAALPKNKTLTFLGLVDHTGPGGGMFGGAAKWTFTVLIEAWRIEGGPVVREKLLVRASRIGERKLGNLMQQFPRRKQVRFTAKAARKQTGPHFTVELAQVRGQVSDKDLAKIAKQSRQPVEFSDRTFGVLRFNREFEFFEGEATHAGEALTLVFHAGSIGEAKELVQLAQPLWRSRSKWFKEFQQAVMQEMFDLCQSRRTESEGPLTRKEFLRLLGNPVGLEFRMEDGELEYSASGYSEKLFGDHGVTATGDLQAGFVEVDEG